jgi:hypothetical protein
MPKYVQTAPARSSFHKKSMVVGLGCNRCVSTLSRGEQIPYSTKLAR